MAGLDTSLQKPDKSTTETTQVLANTDTYENTKTGDFEQKLADPKHSSDTFLHQKCAKCVHKNSLDDLKELIERWSDLPQNVKASIKLLIQSFTK